MEGAHLTDPPTNPPTNGNWDIPSMGRLAGPGHHPYIPHGRELFPSATSSYTHSHPIDFINPDCHLLGKKGTAPVSESVFFFFVYSKTEVFNHLAWKPLMETDSETGEKLRECKKASDYKCIILLKRIILLI